VPGISAMLDVGATHEDIASILRAHADEVDQARAA
jgi:hypothetical protein